MTALEKVRKIREAAREFGPSCDYYALTESEAVALLTDEPSKTAEELIDPRLQMKPVLVELLGYVKTMRRPKRSRCIELIWQIEKRYDQQKAALTAHAKAKVEEAADRAEACYRQNCSGCGEKCNGRCDHVKMLRAAILGHGEAKP